MHQLLLNNVQVTYHIVYQKNRKTIRLKVMPPAQLEVVVPQGYPKASIEKMLQEKKVWIVGQLTKSAALAANPVNKSLVHGSPILFLGKPYELDIGRVQGCDTATVVQSNSKLMIRVAEPDNATAIAPLLYTWFTKNAAAVLEEKTLSWAKKIGVSPTLIRIKDQKTRWGSCSLRGTIHYNWRIIMAPPEVIDYLVIHELCHLQVPNHSPDFWKLIGWYSPAFKQHRCWLKENGALLAGIFKYS